MSCHLHVLMTCAVCAVCVLQVKALLAGAMAAAVCVISANKGIHEGLSALLTKQERVEGEALERWLQHVVVSYSAAVTVAVRHCFVR